MTLRSYILFMTISTAMLWAAWLFVLAVMSPDSGSLAVILFSVTLFFAISAAASVAGLLLRRWARSDDPVHRQVATAFRQSLLFAGLFLASLFFQRAGMFGWGVLLALLLAATLLELFMLFWPTAERRRRQWR